MTELESALARAGVDPAKGLPFGASMAAYALPGIRALEAWRSLRRDVAAIKHWPLLLGGGDSLESHRELLAEHSPEAVVSKATEIDATTFLKVRAKEQQDSGELPRGDWPADAEPSNDVLIHLEVLSKKPLREVFLVPVPTVDPWASLAYIPFGGWNECPFPEEHVAVFRY